MMKKTGTAVIVLIAALVLGTLFGTHRSLNDERNNAAMVFFYGADGSGYSISSNLDLRIEYARNLCKVAADYDAAAEVSAVSDACYALEASEAADEKFDCNNDLSDAVSALSLRLEKQPLSQEDESHRKSLTADIASFDMRIDKLASSYNSAVRMFNDDMLGAFPGGPLGRLLGVEPLEEYA